MAGVFSGTGGLFRLYLRCDRILLPLWVTLSVFLLNGQISFTTVMDDWTALLAELSGSPMTAAILGPITPLSLEGAIMWRGMVQAAMVVMIGAALTAVRHSRVEEQTGRAELLYSRPVGRFASILAISILNGAACLISGVFAAFALIFSGLGGDGAWLAGLTLAFCGLAFSGLGLILSQIFRIHAKGAATAALFISLVPMMLNNAAGAGTAWAWLAPQSWARIVEPYGANRVWPFFVFLLIVFLLPLTAVKLMGKRDFGNGLTPNGKAEAKRPPLCAPRWFSHCVKLVGWLLFYARQRYISVLPLPVSRPALQVLSAA